MSSHECVDLEDELNGALFSNFKKYKFLNLIFLKKIPECSL
jgi:hypothetical protein